MRRNIKRIVYIVCIALVLWVLKSLLIVSLRQKEETILDLYLDFYKETLLSYTTRVEKEEEYKKKLGYLSPDELSALEETHHRNLTLQWGRELLPPAPRIWDIKCHQGERYDERVSLVISYCNEDIIMLLRTITTLVYRTPPANLLEILLIDDGSERDDSEEIKRYAEGLSIPVVLSRNDEQLGIANSRLLGIRKAKGSVIMILDSHVEVGEGWLEPLLRILADKPQALAVPRVKMGDEAKPIGREHGDLYTVILQNGYGLISFGTLIDQFIPGEEHLPLMSPGLMGGAFAGYRDYLLDIFPVGVSGTSWGVENSRISVRSWLCGQGIYVTPCSFVGHTNGPDKGLQRYFKDNEGLLDELKRECMAEVINYIEGEEEKRKMISRQENTKEMVDKVLSISRVIKAQFDPAKHHCTRDFNWYKDTVSTGRDAQPFDSTDSLYIGAVRSLLSTDLCLEHYTDTENRLVLYSCRPHNLTLGDNQLFQFSKNHAVRTTDGKCFDLFDAGKGDVKIYYCHESSLGDGVPGESQRFEYDVEHQWIVHRVSNKCLDASGLGLMKDVHMSQCDVGSAGQTWEIKQAPWF